MANRRPRPDGDDSSMLLHSARHQHQVEHILATQEALRAVNQQLEALPCTML